MKLSMIIKQIFFYRVLFYFIPSRLPSFKIKLIVNIENEVSTARYNRLFRVRSQIPRAVINLLPASATRLGRDPQSSQGTHAREDEGESVASRRDFLLGTHVAERLAAIRTR